MFHGIVRSQIRRILILIFIIRYSQEENSANGEQITESETDKYNENEGDAATTGGTDILTEGQPGWMEKLLKKAMKKVKVSLRLVQQIKSRHHRNRSQCKGTRWEPRQHDAEPRLTNYLKQH